MPMKWTAEQDQKLLMLIIDTVKPDFKTIATEWEKRYRKHLPTLAQFAMQTNK